MNNEEYLKKYLPKDKLEEGLKRLKQGEPVQYIIGNVNFYGNTLKVTKDVLIPRFETELLVNKTINYIKEYLNKEVKILDIGTGSGAISITLKKELNCSIDAIDISEKALEIAKENAKNNKTDINFFKSDIFSNIKDKYDVIISNPPYISEDEEIEDIVKNNEPHIALFAKNKGLEFYEKILKEANDYINKKALIAFEIGRYQGKEIIEIAKKYFPNSKILLEKDYPGIDRYIFIFI